MGEKPSSHSEDRAYEERLKEQRKLEAQKEQSRPPESDQDKQMKVVISERLPVMREEFQKQVKDWQERVKALREKEYSFSNFVTPENYWGFSTLIRGDGNTNSGAKVDIVEAYFELMGMRNIALPRIEFALKEGKRWEDIQKDPLMKSFLDSPEGKLMTSQSPSPDEAMADFYLDKARELRKRIPKGELLAQPLYEKLKGTKHEAVAKQEMMNIAEEVWKKYVSEIGNELLGTDSLLMMAASGPVGGMISKGVKSERLIQASVGTMEAVNTSRLAKVLVPGVKVVQAEASNSTLLKVGKWTLNVGADAAKIGLYHEAVRYLGGNDAAKIAGYILLFIPGAKAGFERDMKAKFGTVAPTSANISAWALEKYGEDNLKKMLGNQGEEIVKQMKEIAATATKNTPATEVGAQGVTVLRDKLATGKIRQPDLPGNTTEEKMSSLYQRAEAVKPQFDGILDDVAQRTGAVEIRKAPLKNPENALEKIKADGGSPEDLKDIVRGTIIYSDVEGVKKGIQTIPENPDVVSYAYKNRLNDPTLRDVLMNFQTGKVVTEVQLHVPEILGVKEVGLKLPKGSIPDNFWTFPELNMLEKLKIPREGMRTLNQNVALPKDGDLVQLHQIYEIKRALPPMDIMNPQEKLLYQKLTAIQIKANDYALELYKQRTGKDFTP